MSYFDMPSSDEYMPATSRNPLVDFVTLMPAC